jgi:hypothetical protein
VTSRSTRSGAETPGHIAELVELGHRREQLPYGQAGVVLVQNHPDGLTAIDVVHLRQQSLVLQKALPFPQARSQHDLQAAPGSKDSRRRIQESKLEGAI